MIPTLIRFLKDSDWSFHWADVIVIVRNLKFHPCSCLNHFISFTVVIIDRLYFNSLADRLMKKTIKNIEAVINYLFSKVSTIQ
ncbi:hypothetical protein B9Z55_028136 [Caenorhabditis nigoni]|uniref:Uncharacterized protein n=1 Tax=Caenorhabditis nigoni TaxID=1611254 RepID=A0A2G5SCY3_9PELO|nr:hypothetical protein B9Z55_028136 [Caenorhabditis nigoni]